MIDKKKKKMSGGYGLLYLTAGGVTALLAFSYWYVRSRPVKDPAKAIVWQGIPFARLAVHADLPRFRLCVDDVRLEEENDARVRVSRFLQLVAAGVDKHKKKHNHDNEKSVSKLESVVLDQCQEVLQKKCSHSDAVSDALLPLLQQWELVLDMAPLCHVLRCCTQSAVAPVAVKTKRGSLAKKYPFNGVQGSWEVTVYSNSVQKNQSQDGGVGLLRVEHKKKEQGRTLPYTFFWHVHFVVDVSSGQLVEQRVLSSEIDVSQCNDYVERQEITKLIQEEFC